MLKFCVILITLKPMINYYNITGTQLSRAYDSVNDLDYTLIKCLNSSSHFENICRKALKVTRFCSTAL